MQITSASVKHQQRRVQSHRKNCSSYRFFNLLTSDTLLDKVEALLPEHRERLYPPTETLSMFLAQAMNADRSCQNIVNQAALQRVAGGVSASSTGTAGYCRARKRLPLDMLSGLTQHLGVVMNAQLPEPWCWQGRRVRLVDGTTVTLPDTPANQAVFPQQNNQQPGLEFPICRVVGITCLASGTLLNAAVGPYQGKGGDERTLLRSIEHTFEAGDIVLGDALFATYFFIAAMQDKGVDILMEQQGSRKRCADFRRGRKLGERDYLITINKPKRRPEWMSEDQYNAAAESLVVRELKINHKILVTTLTCPKQIPKHLIKQLYQHRWNVGLDIRHIKTTLGMDVLSCRTPAMAIKEIWVYFLAYNLIRLIMAQSALLADTNPRLISFKHSLQLWLHYLQLPQSLDEQQCERMLVLMAQQRVGNRPGRIEPRALKRRPKPSPKLTKPRDAVREEVRKNGHPKKTK